VDGTAIRSCLTAVAIVDGREVTAIDRLHPDNRHALPQAWIEQRAPKCGDCQSGQILAAATLLTAIAKPTDADIDSTMARQPVPLWRVSAPRSSARSAPAPEEGQDRRSRASRLAARRRRARARRRSAAVCRA
jgi:isoquinoline 1-oxidoreductase alpha subunit